MKCGRLGVLPSERSSCSPNADMESQLCAGTCVLPELMRSWAFTTSPAAGHQLLRTGCGCGVVRASGVFVYASVLGGSCPSQADMSTVQGPNAARCWERAVCQPDGRQRRCILACDTCSGFNKIKNRSNSSCAHSRRPDQRAAALHSAGVDIFLITGDVHVLIRHARWTCN